MNATARALARETSALLDRVSRDRKSILITRGGLPVAILQPLDGVQFQPFGADEAGGLEMKAPPEVELDSYALSEGARRFLIALDDGLHYLRALKHAPEETFQLLGRLEFLRLTTKLFSGYTLTIEGRTVVAALRAAGWTKEGRPAHGPSGNVAEPT
jgi:antitoxin (DNA-binding transcriptional repressor) of toxin-antitoxin stability system